MHGGKGGCSVAKWGCSVACTVADSTVAGCTVADCTMADSTVAGCAVADCMVADCAVAGSTVADCTVVECTSAQVCMIAGCTSAPASPTFTVESAKCTAALNETCSFEQASSSFTAERLYQSTDAQSSRPAPWVWGPGIAVRLCTRWVERAGRLKQLSAEWVMAVEPSKRSGSSLLNVIESKELEPSDEGRSTVRIEPIVMIA